MSFTRVLLLLLLSTSSYATSLMRSSKFTVMHDKIYQPRDPSSFVANVSSTSTVRCATSCAKYSSCQTTTFYRDTSMCSLFGEPSSLGTTFSRNGAVILTMDPPSEHSHLRFFPISSMHSCLVPCLSNSSSTTLLNAQNISTTNYTFYSYSYKTCATSATITFAFRHDVDSWCLDDVAVWNGSSNVLVNGGFEIGTYAGWNHQNPSNNTNPGTVSYGYGSVLPRTGSYAYIDGIYGNVDYLSQTFTTTPYYPYNISFWLRSSAYSTQSNLVVSSHVSVTLWIDKHRSTPYSLLLSFGKNELLHVIYSG